MKKLLSFTLTLTMILSLVLLTGCTSLNISLGDLGTSLEDLESGLSDLGGKIEDMTSQIKDYAESEAGEIGEGIKDLLGGTEETSGDVHTADGPASPADGPADGPAESFSGSDGGNTESGDSMGTVHFDFETNNNIINPGSKQVEYMAPDLDGAVSSDQMAKRIMTGDGEFISGAFDAELDFTEFRDTAGGKYQHVRIMRAALYDDAFVNSLRPGDTIWLSGYGLRDIQVESVEQIEMEGMYFINLCMDYTLVRSEGKALWTLCGPNDIPVKFCLATCTLVFPRGAEYIDRLSPMATGQGNTDRKVENVDDLYIGISGCVDILELEVEDQIVTRAVLEYHP